MARRAAAAPGGRVPASLTAYAGKRSFAHTPEPPPLLAHEREGPLLFVVQQHAARHLHWDLRLEAGAVLVSWALPQGPSLVAGEKRRAIRTEDHPLAYAGFEGTIPAGQYGAGAMIVWDAGVYSPDDDGRYAFHDREEAEQRTLAQLARGKLTFFLRGHKLQGSFALVRIKPSEQWLLIKHRDRFARADGAPVVEDRSVLSGVTLAQIGGATTSGRTVFPVERLVPAGPVRRLPARLAPMLASPAAKAFDAPDWLFEPKLDGYRVLATIDGDRVHLQSRRGGLDLDTPFPEIRAELAAQCVPTMIVDGELLAFDATGRPSFHALQNRVPGRPRAAVPSGEHAVCILYCFDILFFCGIDLRGRRYDDRRRHLEQCVLPSAHVRIVHVASAGEALHRAAINAGFEGSVAKRRDSVYECGVRSPHWLKIKRVETADYVIGGYTAGRGWRAKQFGSLLLGAPAAGGKLRYVGRVGSGFDDALLDALKPRLATLASSKMPFSQLPQEVGAATWVEPRLIAEVRYAEVTPQGLLRAPVFVRLRDDKSAQRSVETRVRRTRGKPEVAGKTAGVRETAGARERGSEADLERDVAAVVAQLDTTAVQLRLDVGGQSVPLTNLNKVLWRADAALGERAYTKRDLIDYLARVAPYMLPHLADRPLTMIRMPDGIEGERFFQKHWEQTLPPFVDRLAVYSESKSEQHEYLLCNNLPTLLWLGQIGTLEFHVWHSRANTWPEAEGAGTDYASSLDALESSILNYPDYVVFDLDPYIYSGKERPGAEPELNDAGFERAKEVAFWLRELMQAMALEPLIKTSGKTGLHIFLPIVRALDFDAAREVCALIGRHLLQRHPDTITMEWSTKKRTGKVFFDHNMNARAKTLNVAYSPRGAPGGPVSMPLEWDALAHAHPHDFRLKNVPARLRESGDVWRKALTLKQDLTRSLAPAEPEAEPAAAKRRPGKRR